MVIVEEDIHKLKEYYDSLSRYQYFLFRILNSKKLDVALKKTNLEPLEVSLALRDSNPIVIRLFSGLASFFQSKTFEFYSSMFDTLISYNLATTAENFNIILEHQSKHADALDRVQQLDDSLGSFDKAEQILGVEEAQKVFQYLAENPSKSASSRECIIILYKAGILNPTTQRDVEQDPNQAQLEQSLKILFEDGIIHGAEAQIAFDLLMSSYRGFDRIPGAGLLKELKTAGLLEGDLAQQNHAAAREFDSTYLFLKMLNDKKTPVTQDRFNKIMGLSPNVRALLEKEINSYSASEYASARLWVNPHFDKAIHLLSRVDEDQNWQGEEYLVNALEGYKLEILQIEKKATSDARSQVGFFPAGGSGGSTDEPKPSNRENPNV